MSIDKEVRETRETSQDIKKIVENIDQNIFRLVSRPHSVNRAGLYAMVFLGSVGALRACSHSGDVQKELVRLRNEIPVIQRNNVIGNQTPDEYIDVNGIRAYIRIDGEPVEAYLKKGESK